MPHGLGRSADTYDRDFLSGRLKELDLIKPADMLLIGVAVWR